MKTTEQRRDLAWITTTVTNLRDRTGIATLSAGKPVRVRGACEQRHVVQRLAPHSSLAHPRQILSVRFDLFLVHYEGTRSFIVRVYVTRILPG